MEMTQGRQIIKHLKERQHTYLDMMMLGISTCPWKRVLECLDDDEALVIGKRWLGGKRYAKTWKVVKATRYTA
jgi:hypothetical protein